MRRTSSASPRRSTSSAWPSSRVAGPARTPRTSSSSRRARDVDWATRRRWRPSARRGGPSIAVGGRPAARARCSTPARRSAPSSARARALHVREVLRVAPDENLRMIEESVALPRRARAGAWSTTPSTSSTAYREDPAYALETLRRGRAAAAPRCCVLCDTNGGSLPWDDRGAVAPGARGARPPRRHPRPRRRRLRRGQHARRGARRRDATCRAPSTATASAAATPTSAPSSPPSSSRWASAPFAPARSPKLGAGRRGSSPRSPTSRPTTTCPTSARSAFAHKGGVHVAAIRRTAARLRAHRSGARRQPHARRRERALGARQRAAPRPRSTTSRWTDGAEAEVLATVKETRSARLRLRGGGGLGRAPAAAARARLRAAVRARRLQGHPRPAGRRGPFADGRHQDPRSRRAVHTAAEGNGPVSALDAALRKALAGGVPGDRQDPARGLQGPHPRRRPRGRRR